MQLSTLSSRVDADIEMYTVAEVHGLQGPKEWNDTKGKAGPAAFGDLSNESSGLKVLRYFELLQISSVI